MISPSEYQLGGMWCSLSAFGPPLEFGAYTGSARFTMRIAPSLLYVCTSATGAFTGICW
jgi:hypothetical protein